MSLRIAPALTLPDEAVTQTFAILAKRGVGKTYTALVLVEEMVKAGHHVVVCDPIGVAWGLRAAANGKDAGLPITILGGDHGDVPLEVTAGELIADLVIDERLSAVLDLSRFRKGEQTRFMTDFCERLYHKNREPLHLVLDEADAFAPQRPMPGQQRLLGAVEDLVRRGRARGLGVTLVTQRAAVINKDVLTQVEVLVALRTIAPQDRSAVDEWVKVHGTPEQREKLMGSLASLPIGEAWFWSPGWLDIFQHVKVRKRETFDSSATPKVGQKRAEPRQLAPVDLEKLSARIAATVERAKENDPKALRARITQLEREKAAPKVEVQTVEKVVEVPALSPEAEQRLTVALATAEGIAQELRAALAVIRPKTVVHSARPVTAPRPAPAAKRAPSGDGERLGKAERLILSALAQYPQGRSKVQVALLTGYAHGGGSFNNAIGALRSKGYAEGGGDNLRATDAGLDALGVWEALPSGRALVDHWLGQLGKAERLILDHLVSIYPNTATKQEVGEATGYESSGGSFNNALGRLRTLELITRGTEMKASDDFFQ